MELKEFRTLLEIEKLGSISLAAKSLFVSQPGLSQFLQNYEQQLGFPIFERLNQGVRPTQKGEEYLQLIRTLVESYDVGLSSLRGGNFRKVRFAIGDQRGALLIPKIMSMINQNDLGFQLEIHDTISQREGLLNALKRHIVDAICTTMINEDYQVGGEIRVYPLLKEEIMLVLPQNHVLISKLKRREDGQYWIDPEELRDQTYILCDSKREIRKMSDQIFWKLDIRDVNILQSSTSLFTVINSCMNCNALTFSPWEYICENQQCICASLGDEGVYWTHIMLARPGAFRSGELEALRKLVTESLITDMKHMHVLSNL